MSERQRRSVTPLQQLDAAWTAFQASYSGLSEAELQVPGVMEQWSVKDILAHVSTWEEEALRHLPLILAGGRPPRYVSFGGLDAFNAQQAERVSRLSLATVRAQLDATHRSLVAFVQSVPAEQLASTTRARHRLRLDTYAHYPIHTVAIRAWRDGRADG